MDKYLYSIRLRPSSPLWEHGFPKVPADAESSSPHDLTHTPRPRGRDTDSTGPRAPDLGPTGT